MDHFMVTHSNCSSSLVKWLTHCIWRILQVFVHAYVYTCTLFVCPLTSSSCMSPFPLLVQCTFSKKQLCSCLHKPILRLSKQIIYASESKCFHLNSVFYETHININRESHIPYANVCTQTWVCTQMCKSCASHLIAFSVKRLFWKGPPAAFCLRDDFLYRPAQNKP